MTPWSRVQGILDRVQAQVQQQRLRRALSQSRDKPIDVQIGFTVFIDVAQEMRSRLWLVLLQEPALAAPFQVRACAQRVSWSVRLDSSPRGIASPGLTLRSTHCVRRGLRQRPALASSAAVGCVVQELGRFPDLGAFDPSLRQGSGGSPTHSASPGQPPQPAANAVGTHGADQQDATVASSAPLVDAEAAAEGAPAEDDAEAPEVPSASDAAAPGAVGAGAEAKRLHESRESDLADISDVCSDEPVHSQEPDVAAGMIRGGEVGGDEAEPLRGALSERCAKDLEFLEALEPHLHSPLSRLWAMCRARFVSCRSRRATEPSGRELGSGGQGRLAPGRQSRRAGLVCARQGAAAGQPASCRCRQAVIAGRTGRGLRCGAAG